MKKWFDGIIYANNKLELRKKVAEFANNNSLNPGEILIVGHQVPLAQLLALEIVYFADHEIEIEYHA